MLLAGQVKRDLLFLWVADRNTFVFCRVRMRFGIALSYEAPGNCTAIYRFGRYRFSHVVGGPFYELRG